MATPESTTSKRILIVEDDRDIRDALTEILEFEGFTVDTAGNGLEGINHLRSGALLPELILLDLMMPQMDGWQFRAEQFKHDQLSKIPVIILSADNNVGAKAAQLRAHGFLKKPVDLESLLEMIRPILE